MRKIVLCIVGTLTINCGSSKGGTMIGPAGGVVEGPGGARIEIPAGALDEEVSIGIRLASASDLQGVNWSALSTEVDGNFLTAEVTSFSFFQPGASAPEEDDGVEEAGDAYEVTPHGQRFNEPVRVRVPYLRSLPNLGMFHGRQGSSGTSPVNDLCNFPRYPTLYYSDRKTGNDVRGPKCNSINNVWNCPMREYLDLKYDRDIHLSTSTSDLLCCYDTGSVALELEWTFLEKDEHLINMALDHWRYPTLPNRERACVYGTLLRLVDGRNPYTKKPRPAQTTFECASSNMCDVKDNHSETIPFEFERPLELNRRYRARLVISRDEWSAYLDDGSYTEGIVSCHEYQFSDGGVTFRILFIGGTIHSLRITCHPENLD